MSCASFAHELPNMDDTVWLKEAILPTLVSHPPSWETRPHSQQHWGSTQPKK